MTPKEYKAFKIPARKELLEKKIQEAFIMASVALNRVNTDPFSEVEVRQKASSVSRSQRIRPETDERRRLFNTMRRIQRVSPGSDRGSVFFKQASFMEDFEDDYAEQVPFSSYYPYYQMLSHGQLRTYFTWRTQIRKGNIAESSTSYAFIYIYELLNNIGVENPQDGLEKLIGFWLSYREFDDVLDKYMLRWIKDYHIYYPVEWSFHNFTDMYDLKLHYPEVYGYISGREDSFGIFTGISKYDITKSIFYTEQTSRMISLCFYHVLKSLRKTFEGKGLCFEDYVFFTFSRERHWSPFGSALFHPFHKQGNRRVMLSKRESYTCKDNCWTGRAPVISEEGKQLVGYIMKEMEVSLRQIKKFRYSIKADISKCSPVTVGKMDAHDINLPELIPQSVKEFYSLFTRRIIRVDHDSLTQIRRDAMDTQEKLIVPEDMEHKAEELKPVEVFVAEPADDIWIAFKKSLSRTELEALSLILNDQDIRSYALQQGIMAEVLIDGINEKAMDIIGDVVLESGGATGVYEDYIGNIKEMVGSNGS